jgi:hypothetical protein
MEKAKKVEMQNIDPELEYEIELSKAKNIEERGGDKEKPKP